MSKKIDVDSPDFDPDDYTDEELDKLFPLRAMNSGKTLAPLFIYKTLEEAANTDRRFSQIELGKILEEEYEIKLERKAISRIVHLLADVYPEIKCRGNKGVWMAA